VKFFIFLYYFLFFIINFCYSQEKNLNQFVGITLLTDIKNYLPDKENSIEKNRKYLGYEDTTFYVSGNRIWNGEKKIYEEIIVPKKSHYFDVYSVIVKKDKVVAINAFKHFQEEYITQEEYNPTCLKYRKIYLEDNILKNEIVKKNLKNKFSRQVSDSERYWLRFKDRLIYKSRSDNADIDNFFTCVYLLINEDNKIKISTSFVVGLSTANFYDLVDLQTRTVEIEKFDENFIKKFSISGN